MGNHKKPQYQFVCTFKKAASVSCLNVILLPIRCMFLYTNKAFMTDLGSNFVVICYWYIWYFIYWLYRYMFTPGFNCGFVLRIFLVLCCIFLFCLSLLCLGPHVVCDSAMSMFDCRFRSSVWRFNSCNQRL
jgi:hypothetical protein